MKYFLGLEVSFFFFLLFKSCIVLCLIGWLFSVSVVGIENIVLYS